MLYILSFKIAYFQENLSEGDWLESLIYFVTNKHCMNREKLDKARLFNIIPKEGGSTGTKS